MSSKKIITLDNLQTFKTNADNAYQPKNSKLTSISGLSNSSTGLVKLTNGTASLDTSTYATQNYVDTAISNLPEPMVFKGTLGQNGTITALPTPSASNEGYTYKVIKAGTYAAITGAEEEDVDCKKGDVFVSAKIGSTYCWVYIPAGDDVEDTWRNVKVNRTELLFNAISTGAVNFKNGSNVTITGSGNDITIAATDTTYESKTAAQNGTAVSLVTTGEKYTWNNKQNALSTQTAYTAVGSASAIPVITTNTLGQVTSITTTAVSIPSVDQTYSSSSTNAQSGTAVAGALANYLLLTGGDITYASNGSYGIKVKKSGNTYYTNQIKNDGVLVSYNNLGSGVEYSAHYKGDGISTGSYTLSFPTLTANATIATKDDIVQSDWNEASSSSKAYIQNKPSTTSSVTSGSSALVTSGAVFTALGLNSGETGLIEATTAEINALFA